MVEVQQSHSEEDERRIVTLLRQSGVDVASVWELVNAPCAKAIPVLVEFVNRDINTTTKEAIVRALSIPAAKRDAVRPLINEFKRADLSPSLRWAIGNALGVLASDEESNSLLDLARNKQYGTARQMLVLGLAKLKTPLAIDVLVELLNDPDVQGHAIIVLGKLRAVRARPNIESFLHDAKAWIRREAKKAITRIEIGR
jgi:HEAT repeat protein